MKPHKHLPPVRLDVPNLPHVDLDTIRDHLIAHHAVTGLGLPIAVQYSAGELLAWHDADHRLLDPVGLPLEHRHTDITTGTGPATVIDSGRLIHEGNLRAVREGKRIANLTEILDRAAQVQARCSRPTVATAAGGADRRRRDLPARPGLPRDRTRCRRPRRPPSQAGSCLMGGGRLMSVALTADAVIEGRKLVTRRLGWWTNKHGRRLVRPGDRLQLCRKVMGRKPGEPLERLRTVEVVDVSRQPLLVQNTPHEAELEGFPDWTWDEFVEFFCEEMCCKPTVPVTRIAWRYLDEAQR